MDEQNMHLFVLILMMIKDNNNDDKNSLTDLENLL